MKNSNLGKKKLIQGSTWFLCLISCVIILSVILSMIFSLGCAHRNENSTARVINQPLDEEFKIGVIFPLTGQQANFGADVVAGAQLFVDNHLDVKLFVEDDKFNPKESISAYRKLRDINEIKYFIGPFGPVGAEALYGSMSSQDKKEVIALTVSLCTNSFKDYENIMCTYPGLDRMIKNSADFIYAKGKHDVYVVTEQSATGEMLIDLFKKYAESDGINLVGIEKIDFTTETTFYTYVTKIKAKNPEVVYIASSAPILSFTFIKLLKEQKINSLIVTNLDVEEDNLVDFNQTLEGVYFPGFISSKYDADFTNAFRIKYGKEPNLYNALGYEIAALLYDVHKLESEGMSLKEKVILLENKYDYAIPLLKYDSDGLIDIEFEPKQVINGQLIPVK